MFWGYPYFDTNPFRGEAPNLCTSLPFGSSAHVVKMSKSGSQETSANLAIREVLGIHPPLGLLGMSFGCREAASGGFFLASVFFSGCEDRTPRDGTLALRSGNASKKFKASPRFGRFFLFVFFLGWRRGREGKSEGKPHMFRSLYLKSLFQTQLQKKMCMYIYIHYNIYIHIFMTANWDGECNSRAFASLQKCLGLDLRAWTSPSPCTQTTRFQEFRIYHQPRERERERATCLTGIYVCAYNPPILWA